MSDVRLSVLFLVLAVIQGITAIRVGMHGWWMAWIAVSCTFVALAYALGKPRWFGKRDDGSLSLPLVLLNAPFLLLAHFALQIRRGSREPAWNEVAPGLYLGRRVGEGELPPNVSVVVDLTAEFAEPTNVRRHRLYLPLPTLDGCAPDPTALRRMVDQLAPMNDRVFIHCAVGHGRSATVAAALLLARGIVSTASEAETVLQQHRPLVKLKPSQRAVLAMFERPPSVAAV